jgi:hypothetical protein
VDYFLEIDTHLQGIGIRSMHIPDAKKVASKVFDAQLRNIADGGHLFAEYFMLLASARWIGEAAGAQKVSLCLDCAMFCGTFIACMSSRCLQ